MHLYKFFVIILIFLITGFAYSQDYQNISIDDGLPSNNVYRIAQDAYGFIWFITDKGMVKYDGATMKVFSTKEGLPVNDIWNIRVTPDGKVWYFSKSRELGYILDDVVYSFPSEVENEMLIPNVIFQAGNEIGFGNQGVQTLVNGKWTNLASNYNHKKEYKVGLLGKEHKRYLSVNGITTTGIVKDSLGAVLWEFNWDIFGAVNAYTHGQVDVDNYASITPEGIDFLNFRKHQVINIPIRDVFDEQTSRFSRVNNVLGQLQLTNEYGVARLNADLEVISVVKVPKELGSHFSFQDKDGNIWAASLKNGVFFRPRTSQISTLFVNQKVKDICPSGSNLLINVQGQGLHKVASKSFDTELLIPTNEYLYGIFCNETSNISYLTTRKEIYTWKEGQKIIEIVPNNRLNVNTKGRQFIDDGDVGYGNSSTNLNKIDVESFEIKKTIKFPGISSLLKMGNQLLIGSNNGLYILPKNLDVTLKKDLLDKPIICITELSDGSVLAGSDGYGAYVMNDGEFKEIEGSEDLSVEDIAEDTNGLVYLATNRGIAVFEKESDLYGLTRWILKADGLTSNKVNSVTIMDSHLYAGSDDGLAILDLDLLKNQTSIPDIYIESISIGDKHFKSDTIVSKYDNDHSLLAAFGILDFKGQKEIQKEYQLLPISNEWYNIETNQINIGNLDPANYKLTFKATDHKGISTEKMIIITIKPLWYQSNWFRFFYIIAGILIVTIISYYVVQQYQKKQTLRLIDEKKVAQIELKALRSQMNPHFVFNSLSAIQYYINNNENEISEKYLVKFSKLIRKFFQLSGENEIMLSEEIELLTSYLEIEQLRFKEKLSFTVEVDQRIDIKQFSIPTMLLQPVVENAVNHGIFNKEDNGTVTVLFSKITDEEISITIEDDGVGYNNTLKRSSKKKSSSVTAERLHFLNQSDKWKISHHITEAFPENTNPGATINFTIKRLK